MSTARKRRMRHPQSSRRLSSVPPARAKRTVVIGGQVGQEPGRGPRKVQMRKRPNRADADLERGTFSRVACSVVHCMRKSFPCRASSPRTAGPLLPHARLSDGRRGRGAGEVASRLAVSRQRQGRRAVAPMALPSGYELLPRKYACGVVPSIVRNISMKALTLS